jgi:hypothetical protein
VDGARVAQDTQAGLGGATGGLHIGAGPNAGRSDFWSGYIDDVRIYARVIEP